MIDSVLYSAPKIHLTLFPLPATSNPNIPALKYVVMDNASRQTLTTEEIDSLSEITFGNFLGRSVNRAKIALDPRTNTPHFLYWRLLDPPELKLARKDGNRFPSETVYTGARGAPAFASSALAIDSEGTLYVAYLVKSGAFVAPSPAHGRGLRGGQAKPDDHASLFLATKRSGVWTTETIDNSGTVEFVHDIFVVPP